MKKALSVAINKYVGAPLRGCINDSEHIKSWLESKDYEVIVLHDEQATKQNIINQIKDILSALTTDDQFIFHYSGHGSQIPTNDAAEEDHLTEILCPFDLIDQTGNWTTNFITDDELASMFSNAVCHIECFMDCCHSGSSTREFSPTVTSRYIQSPIEKELAVTKFQLGPKSSVICWSGCKDDQTSADAYINNKFQGAFTAALLQTSGTRDQRKYHIVEYMRINGFTQIPQLYCPDELLSKDIFL